MKEIPLEFPSSEGRTACLTVQVADSWLSRLVGLLKYSSLDDKTALWLLPCTSIHTMWMRFSIDVIFLDANSKVLKISENVRPFLFRMAPKNTQSVLEMAAFNAQRLNINVNDKLDLQQ